MDIDKDARVCSSASGSLYLSVLVPMYNASHWVPENLIRIYDYFQSSLADSKIELILIDDGSADGTAEKIREFSQSRANIFIVTIVKNMGKGFALARGVEIARGELIFFTDIDLSTDLHWFNVLHRAVIKQGADMAFASRMSKASAILVKQNLFRRVFGIVYYAFTYSLLGLKGVEDPNCGFKLFRRDVAKYLFSQIRTNRWAFDIETTLLSKMSDLKIHYVPVTWESRPYSRVRVFTDPIRTMIDIFKIFYYLRQGRYGVINLSRTELESDQKKAA